MKNLSLYTILISGFLTQLTAVASRITLSGTQGSTIIVSVTVERPEFHETIGVGLADTRYDNAGYADFTVQPEKVISIDHEKPVIINLTIAPKPGGQHFQPRTYPLYLQPDEQLTVSVGTDGKLTFQGVNASRQEFLSGYFLENHYQYLPALGNRYDESGLAAMNAQIDSLQQRRSVAFQQFKSQTSAGADKSFEQYIEARMMTEPYLLQTHIADKQMRQNRAVRLSPQQRQELDDFTLQQFKVLPDGALLSKSYRDELRHWIQIPVMKNYPNDSTYQKPVDPLAIADIYRVSQEKLAEYPAQKEYLLTYWLNYAATALKGTQTAQLLLKEFKTNYPQSAHGVYFENLLSAKEKLNTGNTAPDMQLLTADSSEISLASLRGKPVCLVFAFNPRQFENDLKKLEEQFSDKVQFVYACISPAIPFSFWKKNTTVRPGVHHLWASPEQIDTIQKEYVAEIRYPFVVIDRNGAIQERWIPQQFPNNSFLEAELKKVQ